MSQFFERNKKKGVLALLLLFLRKGKGAAPIVAMSALLAFVFIIPSGYSGYIPGLVPWAEKFGMGKFLGGRSGSDFEALREGFASAARPRDSRGRLAIEPPMRSSLIGQGRSSIAYVQGKGLLPKEGGALGDSVAQAGGKSVEGVLRPEDAKKMGQGVSLGEEELHNGLKNLTALSDGPGPAFPGVGGASGGQGRSAAAATGPRVKGPRASNDKQADMMAAAMSASLVPSVGSSGSRAGGGRLSGIRQRGSRPVMNAGPELAKRGGSNSAFFQLAESRAYGIAAAPPPGYCGENCPREFASNASGAVFDGKRPPIGSILAVPELGDPGVPMTPDEGQIGTLTDQAQSLEEDAKKCEDAERVYGPQERAKMDEIHDLSCRLDNDAQQSGDCVDAGGRPIQPLNCNDGGCGGNVSACQAVGDEIKVKCREFNRISQQKAQACPLMNGRYSSHNCDQ